jgi:transposase
VDEKSQIQALDRSQPVLPMMPGVPERRSHDYVRAGTITLFAALEVATGKVIGSLHRRHRAIEFKKFLTKLDKEVPADLDVHLILDNYVTHKTPAIKQWLLAHPRFHLHFTPTSSSWLNLVERWFAELTQKKLKRGVHRSVQALERDIRSWLTDWNEHPRPFVWTKTADEILDKVAAYCRRISDSDHYRPGVRGVWKKYKPRETTEAVVGAVTGPVAAPRTVLLGRFDAAGRLPPCARSRAGRCSRHRARRCEPAARPGPTRSSGRRTRHGLRSQQSSGPSPRRSVTPGRNSMSACSTRSITARTPSGERRSIAPERRRCRVTSCRGGTPLGEQSGRSIRKCPHPCRRAASPRKALDRCRPVPLRATPPTVPSRYWSPHCRL